MRSLVVAIVLFVGCFNDDAPPQPAAVDAAADMTIDMQMVDPCAQCGVNQLCIQSFGGVCTQIVTCVPLDPDCPGGVFTPCSSTCESRHCGAPYQCQNRVTCGGESPTAFACYGP